MGLYPNIPHEERLKAIKNALDTRKQTFSTDSLIELAECALKNNIFEHNNSIFEQLTGTAVGTKMSPPYGSMFMEDILNNSLLKPLAWWHYIDGIFIMWEHEEEEFQKFLEALNIYHPTTKVTAEYSRVQLNFLDLTVMKKCNQLVTDFYVKLTDTHQYLYASSCNFSHIKKSIPFRQALRLNRNSSVNNFLETM